LFLNIGVFRLLYWCSWGLFSCGMSLCHWTTGGQRFETI